MKEQLTESVDNKSHYADNMWTQNRVDLEYKDVENMTGQYKINICLHNL